MSWEAEAQRAAEERLVACQEAMYAADEIEDPAEWPESPAVAPFCGCDTCVVREVLDAAWPHIPETGVLECEDCRRMTTPDEAALRRFNTGRCGECNGRLR